MDVWLEICLKPNMLPGFHSICFKNINLCVESRNENFKIFTGKTNSYKTASESLSQLYCETPQMSTF